MRFNKILQFFILHSTLLVNTLIPSTAQSPPLTTCFAGYFKTGHKANVTCHFYHFATDQKNGVHIMLRDFQNPQRFPENEVLKCTFTGDAVSVCEADDGYRFVSFDKNILTMEITKVSPKFEGSYTCGVTPSSGGEVYPCMLLVDSGIPRPVAEEEIRNGNPVVYVNLVLLIILLGMAVAMFTFACYKMKWVSFSKVCSRFSRKKTESDTEKGREEETVPLSPTQVTETPAGQARSPTPVSPASASGQEQRDNSKRDTSNEDSDIEEAEEEKATEVGEAPQVRTTDKKSCVVQ